MERMELRFPCMAYIRVKYGGLEAPLPANLLVCEIACNAISQRVGLHKSHVWGILSSWNDVLRTQCSSTINAATDGTNRFCDCVHWTHRICAHLLSNTSVRAQLSA